MINNNTKLWLEALESGRYQQGKFALAVLDKNKPLRYCCLGVACEVARENGVDLKVNQIRDRLYYNGDTLCLPLVVINWLGLSTNTGEFENDQSLTSINDDGATFEEIADIIRSEPKGLFIDA